ncbi:MAG TPA: STAS domain-containing protein [Acidimicrobiia bacterium]|nr:STAS domain-containing protein [Acidimicrobiia bacterium]
MLEIRMLPSPAGSPSVVKIVGRLDRFSAATFSRGLASIPGSIRLDCSDLVGIDSAGFAALVMLHDDCRARGDRLVVTDLVTPPRSDWHAWPGLDRLELEHDASGAAAAV